MHALLRDLEAILAILPLYIYRGISGVSIDGLKNEEEENLKMIQEERYKERFDSDIMWYSSSVEGRPSTLRDCFYGMEIPGCAQSCDTYENVCSQIKKWRGAMHEIRYLINHPKFEEVPIEEKACLYEDISNASEMEEIISLFDTIIPTHDPSLGKLLKYKDKRMEIRKEDLKKYFSEMRFPLHDVVRTALHEFVDTCLKDESPSKLALPPWKLYV